MKEHVTPVCVRAHTHTCIAAMANAGASPNASSCCVRLRGTSHTSGLNRIWSAAQGPRAGRADAASMHPQVRKEARACTCNSVTRCRQRREWELTTPRRRQETRDKMVGGSGCDLGTKGMAVCRLRNPIHNDGNEYCNSVPS